MDRGSYRTRGLGILATLLLAAACARTEPPEVVYQRIHEGLNEGNLGAMQEAVQVGLETRQSNDGYDWFGEDGMAGTITPLRTFKIKTGHYCRDYRTALGTIAAQVSLTKRACRNDEGVWIEVPYEDGS